MSDPITVIDDCQFIASEFCLEPSDCTANYFISKVSSLLEDGLEYVGDDYFQDESVLEVDGYLVFEES